MVVPSSETGAPLHRRHTGPFLQVLSPRPAGKATAAPSSPSPAPPPGLAGHARIQDETNVERPCRSGHYLQPDQAVSRAQVLGREAEQGLIKYAWRSPPYCAQGWRVLQASCPHKLLPFPGCRPGADSLGPTAALSTLSSSASLHLHFLTPSVVCRAGERPYRRPS